MIALVWVAIVGITLTFWRLTQHIFAEIEKLKNPVEPDWLEEPVFTLDYIKNIMGENYHWNEQKHTFEYRMVKGRKPLEPTPRFDTFTAYMTRNLKN